ncbi:hypothetical protein [Gemmata sp.]|uniref:hypothetical protein n=1 Tax=Gemmata sp. TaxID=1914242 RepID=UPI003F71F869
MRVLASVGLAGCLGTLLGCGGAQPPADPAQVQVAPPGDTGEAAAPTRKADPYEIDPAKHVVPAAPAAGVLGGKPFAPDRVELEGHRLTLRQGKDFFADLEVVLAIHEQVKLGDGVKIVVRPNQRWTDRIPSLQSAVRSEKGLPDVKFINDDYALTLELGKPEKGKIPGSIYLCLPDSSRSYLAGTFVAERKRGLNDPPGADDAPFIRGTLSPPVKKDEFVTIGYVGRTAGGEVISDGCGASVYDGGGGAVRSGSFAPRAASLRFEKFVPHYDFARLPPGRYLVHARVKDGPLAWAWAEVAAGGQVTTDLKLAGTALGTVEVKVPPRTRDVRLVPADLGVPAPDEKFLGRLEFALDLAGEAKDGVATIANVPAGRYQVRSGDLRTGVEVTAGRTAKVELKAAK